MASQHGSRFVSPVYNQNFSPNVFNVNPGMNRPPRPQFQSPPNPPNGSSESPDRFVHGFQNRPQFSNFPGTCGFLNRPPPAPSSTAHHSPLPDCNPFSSSSNSHPPFPCGLNSHPSFPGPSNPPPFPGSSNPHPFSGSQQPPLFTGSSNPPPFPGSSNPPSFPGSSNPPSFPGSSNPPPFHSSSNPPPFHGSSNSNPPPFHGSSNSNPPSFHGSSNSNPPSFHGSSNRPAFHGSSNSNPPSFHGSSNRPAFHGSSNPPPFHGSSNRPAFHGSSNPPPFHGSSNPPAFHGSSNSPSHFPGASNSPSPFPSASNSQFPPAPHAPSQPSFFTRPLPPPPSHHSPVPSHKPPPSLSPFSDQRPFSPHQAPPQHSPLSNTPHHSRQNQFPLNSHPRNQHERFHGNSPSPASRPRFDTSFQRPYRSWNQTTRFSGPRTPFSNRSPNVKSNQFKDTSQQVSRKKEKSREFRKLKSWMTDELFTEVKKKNALYLKAKSSDEQTAWQEFRLQRNRVSSLIKEAKIKAGLITRKVKEDDSTEKPYSCDTCDKAFASRNELNDHTSQHIKCDYETCTFEAHAKIVLLHKKMQHETGYAERINKLKDDAEVRKWREERRKRFPTAENIKKRQAEQAEKAARGEVLETKEFGKFKKRREDNSDLAHNDGYSHRRRMRGHRGWHRGKRNNFRRNYHEPGFQRFKVDSESDSDSDSHISLSMFSGLSSLSNSAEEQKCHSNETVETSSSEQNLSKSILNTDENHLNLSYSENNSTDTNIESPVLSNAEKSRGKKRTADESILELPEDKIDTPKRPLIVIEDSDDDGPEVVAISKSMEEIDEVDEMEKMETGPGIDPVPKVSKTNHEKANRGKKRTADESILELPEDKIDTSKRPLIAVEGSDDEGPEAMAISKSEEEIHVSEINQKDTKLDINAEAKDSTMNDKEASKEEKKVGSVVNDEPKLSEMNREDVSKSNQSRRHRARRENNFSAKQHGANKIRKNTLLEKLLADDIRHERNVILQCIRHIVNNNFFGLAVKKS